MNIYFDTEFTSLVKDTTLISIGLVADNNEYFYAEFNDYNKDLVDDWIQQNVIDKLIIGDSFNNTTIRNKDNIRCKGDKLYIREVLLNWLKHFDEDINFISDVCHYDMVLLIDLLADTALDVPDYVTPVCHDINQDIAKYFNISEKEAFDKSREEIASSFINSDDINKHNSLFDAKIIKIIYNSIIRKGE